ncbi:tyrosine-type recombinase/integrase [Rubrimonas cliftonensis]|uniref:Integrase n=1 Tax=Rubrimonas cliftonensis TaxID=89524 RepID=A0A1H3ZZJ9_9RHOB|nr:site-specific integrase [Rubrimonas cliftonensis]SEA29135.1 Integrase [Rubrimonas cliftonensis]
MMQPMVLAKREGMWGKMWDGHGAGPDGGEPSRTGKAKGPHRDRRLTALFVKKAPPGRHTDGGGLFLVVDPSGARRWLLRVVVQGSRRDFGLGSATLVSLLQAREKAQTFRAIARAGGDPKAEQDAAARARTPFSEVAEKVFATKIRGNNRNAKHVDQWITTLRTYAFPKIGKRPVDAITRPDIVALLEPIWLEKQETARRVLQRLKTVFDYALAMEYRTGANPVEGVRKALATQKAKVRHFEAMPWEMAPDFVATLEAVEGVAALALRFTIFTALRSGTVRQATWNEISEETGLWLVPGEKMKGGEDFAVPLSEGALRVLGSAKAFRTGARSPVFPPPAQARRKSDGTRSPYLSENAMLGVMKRWGGGYTVHGFRSTFRDWSEAQTGTRYSHEVKEAALAHSIKNKTEAAYRRLDYFEQRMPLMNEWSRFLCGDDVSAEEQAIADTAFTQALERISAPTPR